MSQQPGVPPAGGANDPPQRAKKVPRALAKIQETMRDAKAMEEIRNLGSGLLFYDKNAPSTMKRRANARAIFEGYCESKLDKEEPSYAEMYNKETIIERTWESVLLLARTIEGRIGDKPKAGVLYQYKEALYWWIVRHIPDFTSIFVQWHNVVSAAIHKAAITYSFETQWRQKNRLTAVELDLFWKQIPEFSTGRENWKQHFIAWNLAFMTSVRPGSMTTCWGYERGTLLADGKTSRNEDETLRWSDVSFFRVEDGIACKLTFRYMKGHRDPNKQTMIQGKRTFTFLPLNSNQYHMDTALLLTAWAFLRGLFSKYDNFDAFWTGDDRFIELDEKVSRQAIFVASGQDSALKYDEPMRERALNPKLQEMCEAVGLFERNTMYSFRRTAIVETRRKHGTETAQELAMHVPGGATIYAYDDESLEDVDLANDRLNLSVRDRAEVRKMFAQSEIARVLFDPNAMPVRGSGDLQQQLNDESVREARADSEFTDADENVRGHLSKIEQHLMSLGVDQVLLDNEKAKRGYLATFQASNESCTTLLDELDKLVHKRLLVLRRLKKSYRVTIKARMMAEAKKNQKVVASKGKGTLGTRGRAPDVQQNLLAQSNDANIDAQHLTEAIQQLSDNLTQEEAESANQPDAEQTREEELEHTSEEPDQWEKLPDEVTIVVEKAKEDTAGTSAGRYQFAKKFLELQSVQSSKLTCLQCKLDGTVPYAVKAGTWSRNQLDVHLESTYHTRTAQISRAWVIDHENESAPCPLCEGDDETEYPTANAFIKHVGEEHDEQFAD